MGFKMYFGRCVIPGLDDDAETEAVAEEHARLSLLVNKQIQLSAQPLRMRSLNRTVSGLYGLRTMTSRSWWNCGARTRCGMPPKEFAPVVWPKLTDLMSLFGVN